MKSAVSKGRLGRQEELAALKRLDEQSRRLERYVTGPDLKEIVGGEFRDSARFGGRSIFGWEPQDDEATAAVPGDRAALRRNNKRSDRFTQLGRGEGTPRSCR